MPERVLLTSRDPRYPSRLRAAPHPPAALITQGGSLEAPLVIAIVGSRRAAPQAADLARDLARRAAQQGLVVVSGGRSESMPLPTGARWRAQAAPGSLPEPAPIGATHPSMPSFFGKLG